MRFFLASHPSASNSFLKATCEAIAEAKFNPSMYPFVYRSVPNEERYSNEQLRPLSVNSSRRQWSRGESGMWRLCVRAVLVGFLGCVTMGWLGEQGARMDTFQSNSSTSAATQTRAAMNFG